MQIDKSQILELLRSQGQHDQADQAEGQLPDQVDTEDSGHQNMLSSLGVNPMELVSKFAGGGGGRGGLGGLLGG